MGERRGVSPTCLSSAVRGMPMQLILIAALGLVPPADAEPDLEVRKRQAEMITFLKKGVEARRKEFEAGRRTLDNLIELARPLRDAEVTGATKPAGRGAAHQRCVKRMAELELMTNERWKSGRGLV